MAEQKSNTSPRIIGVCGMSCSGKTTIAKALATLMTLLGYSVTVLSMDHFYKDHGTDKTNFDSPDAFDWPLILKAIKDLRQGKDIEVPWYDYKTHSRIGTRTIKSADIIIFEGILTFANKDLFKLFSTTVYVDVDPKTCLKRRIARNILLGRSKAEITNRWDKFVYLSYTNNILPHKDSCSFIVNNNNNKNGKPNADCINNIFKNIIKKNV